MIAQKWPEMNRAPIYQYSNDYAQAHDELDLYWASLIANIACKDAIETAVSAHYSGHFFDSQAAVRDVVQEFGFERTLYVLAATIKHMDWEPLFSGDNLSWAESVPISECLDTYGSDRSMDFIVDRWSPGLTNLFVSAARQEFFLSQQHNEISGQRPDRQKPSALKRPARKRKHQVQER